MKTKDQMDTDLVNFYTQIKTDNERRIVAVDDLAEIAEFERSIGQPDDQLEQQVDTERIRANNITRELKARGF